MFTTIGMRVENNYYQGTCYVSCLGAHSVVAGFYIYISLVSVYLQLYQRRCDLHNYKDKKNLFWKILFHGLWFFFVLSKTYMNIPPKTKSQAY